MHLIMSMSLSDLSDIRPRKPPDFFFMSLFTTAVILSRTRSRWADAQ